MAAAPAIPYLIAASTLISAGGIYMQYQSQQSAAKFQQYQLEVQNQQLEQERRATEIQQMQEENRRLEEARRIASSNRATLAASGIGENMSFMMGMTPGDTRRLSSDIANIRLGSLTAQSRLADQIAVNRVSSANAAYTARAAGWTALGDLAQTGLQSYGYYRTYGTPSIAPGSRTTG